MFRIFFTFQILTFLAVTGCCVNWAVNMDILMVSEKYTSHEYQDFRLN